MNQNMMLNYFLANNKKKELEDQGIKVPSDFLMKGLMYSMIAPNMPYLGYMIIDKEAKKLVAQNAIVEITLEEAMDKEDAAVEHQPHTKFVCKDDKGENLKNITIIAIAGNIQMDASSEKINKSDIFDYAITDDKGEAHIFYPKDKALTFFLKHGKDTKREFFEVGKVPATIKTTFKSEVAECNKEDTDKKESGSSAKTAGNKK